jgi:hypothetical protein
MGPKTTTPGEAKRLIDALGGTAAVARLFNIKSASVSGWKQKGMPLYREQFVRLLRPDLFSKQNNNDS